MTDITFKIVERFFDRPAVARAVDKAKRKELSKAGAFVRTTARRSIKPAGKRATKRKRQGKFRAGNDPTISRPGKPPRLHTRSKRNLKLILFAWEPVKQSVVVGPMLFKTVDGTRVPEVLEHGGTSTVRRRGGARKTIRVRARPFVLPALKTEAPKFPNLFSNSVRP